MALHTSNSEAPSLPAHDSPYLRPMRLVFLLVLGASLVSLAGSGMQTEDPLFPYLIFSSSSLLYALFTSISLVTTRNIARYWNQSIIGYVALLLTGLGLSYLMTGISVLDTRSYYMIYVVVTIGYLVFLSIMRLVRFVMDYAHKPHMK